MIFKIKADQKLWIARINFTCDSFSKLYSIPSLTNKQYLRLNLII